MREMIQRGMFLPAVALLVVAMPSRASRADAGRPGTAPTPSPIRAVFEPPSPEDLAKITHPELRSTLLRMAHEDQWARSSGR